MDAIDVLSDIRSVFSRIQCLGRPDAKTQPDYIETLRQLSNVLSDASSHVRTLLNAVATINTLPPELLAHIFIFYATETVRIPSIVNFDAYEPFNYPSPRTALRLTEVCKHWRSVSLSTPSLWSGVICGGADATPTVHYLHRSKSLPLHAIIKGDLEGVEDLLTTHPSRIQHLFLLDTASWTRRYDPRRLLTNVAPELLTCALDLHPWPRGPSLPELGYTLFSGGASRLRALSLHSAKLIPLDSLPNLRALALYHILGIPSLPHILALLGRCPALEEVCVHSNREVARIPLDARFEVVELRRVQKLALLIQNPVWLLQHLAIPASALVRVDDITLQQLLDWPHLPPPIEPPSSLSTGVRELTRLRISSPKGSPIHSGIVAELRVELAGAGRTQQQPERGVCLNITVPTSTTLAVRGKAVANVFTTNGPLFAHVTVLWAVRQCAALAPILHALPGLRVLGVVLHDGGSWVELGDALSVAATSTITKDRGRDRNRDRDVACPALETLCAYNCQCRGSSSELQPLRDIAVSRAHARHRLKRFALECDDSESALSLSTNPHGHPNSDGGGPHEQQQHLSAIRAHVDELVLMPRRGPANSRPCDVHSQLLPAEWREELGCADNGGGGSSSSSSSSSGHWPDWDFFAESRGGSRGGSLSLG